MLEVGKPQRRWRDLLQLSPGQLLILIAAATVCFWASTTSPAGAVWLALAILPALLNTFLVRQALARRKGVRELSLQVDLEVAFVALGYWVVVVGVAGFFTLPLLESLSFDNLIFCLRSLVWLAAFAAVPVGAFWLSRIFLEELFAGL